VNNEKNIEAIPNQAGATNAHAGSLDEFSKEAIPQSERRGFFSLVFIWIGYVFTVTIMTAGGNLALGAANLIEALSALAVGYALLISIGIIIAIIAVKTGLTFALLMRYTFGNLGSHVIALAAMVCLLGWFSINCYLIGSITNQLFPGIPIGPVCIVAGIAMTTTAFYGVKLMSKVGTVATILIVGFGLYSLYLAIVKVGGISALFAIEQTQSLVGFNVLVSIAVGSVVNGVVDWTPDIMRFAKDKGTAIAVMVVSICICAPFMVIIGIVGVLVYGKSDIAFIMQAQGLLGAAWFAMVANIWSTAQGNVYSSSLSLANTFTTIPRQYLVIIFGGIGTVMGLFGLYTYFGHWLSFLASMFPSLSAVVIADYFMTYSCGKKMPTIGHVKANFPLLNWWSFLSLFTGVIANFTIPFGISAVNAFIAAFIMQSIFAICVARKTLKVDADVQLA